MKAIHGGKAKNDKVDSYKIANLIRGGTFPMAFVYPREMRATFFPKQADNMDMIAKGRDNRRY